jgi:hypothetical protein
MAGCDFGSEASVRTLLLDTAKLHDDAPEVITAKRTQGKGTVIRHTTFVIRCAAENKALVNAISALTLTYDQNLWFEGSEVNLQSGQNDIAYIYVTAVIRPILT